MCSSQSGVIVRIWPDALNLGSETRVAIKEECGALWRGPTRAPRVGFHLRGTPASVSCHLTPSHFCVKPKIHGFAQGPSEPTPSGNVELMWLNLRRSHLDFDQEGRWVLIQSCGPITTIRFKTALCSKEPARRNPAPFSHHPQSSHPL